MSLPLGCAGSIEPAQPRQTASNGKRSLPPITEARLQECVETYHHQLSSIYQEVHYRVKVDGEGRIVDVETSEALVDGQDFAACVRVVLREMAVPNWVFALRKEYTHASTKAQTSAARGAIGDVTVMGVEVVLEELLAVVGGTTVLFAVVIVLAEGGVANAVEAIEETTANRRRCDDKRTACLDTYRASRPGPTYGSSRCEACHNLCIALEGEWPSHVTLGGRQLSCK